MADVSHRTPVPSSVACALLLITAGCATNPTESPSRTTTTETDTPTEELTTTATSTTETTAAPTTETTETSRPNRTSGEQVSATTTKGVFGTIEEELKVNNYLNSSERVRVEIESDNGTVVFDRAVQVDGNSSKEFDFEFPHTGAYTVAVNTSLGNESVTWDVTRRNPTVAMTVVLIGDDELHVGLEAI